MCLQYHIYIPSNKYKGSRFFVNGIFLRELVRKFYNYNCVIGNWFKLTSIIEIKCLTSKVSWKIRIHHCDHATWFSGFLWIFTRKQEHSQCVKKYFWRLLLSQLLSQRHTLKCFTLLKIYFKRAFKIFYANFQLLAFCLALVAPLFLLRRRSGCHPTTRARNEPSPKFPQSQPQSSHPLWSLHQHPNFTCTYCYAP